MSERSLTLFDLAPGKVLRDRYELLRPHRQGGMSATFEVEDRQDSARRELQIFPAALFETRSQSSDFADVMSAWLPIDAPAVLRVRAVEQLDDGSLLLVTDFPPGIALRDWLKDHGRMECAQALELGRRMLAGLVAIHAAGRVHGDIKPYTIHLAPGDVVQDVMLVDGGITPGLWSAKHLGDKTALIGTPYYAPVEQFGGESPDVQSDIYNLATVLYEVVTGSVPWSGSSFLDVFQAKLEKEPPMMSARASDLEVPEDFESVVRGGLMADRRERYASAQEFLDVLAEL